jgi:hypothetical protein
LARNEGDIRIWCFEDYSFSKPTRGQKMNPPDVKN